MLISAIKEQQKKDKNNKINVDFDLGKIENFIKKKRFLLKKKTFFNKKPF